MDSKGNIFAKTADGSIKHLSSELKKSIVNRAIVNRNFIVGQNGKAIPVINNYTRFTIDKYLKS